LRLSKRLSRLSLTLAIFSHYKLQRSMIELAFFSEAHDGIELLAAAAKCFTPWRSRFFLVRSHGNPLLRTFPDKVKRVKG
jgi:hypothetical protein